MSVALDKTVFAEVSALIAQRMGLHFPEDRWNDLARGLASAGSELGFRDPVQCLGWLQSGDLSTHQLETLASHLTVGETYFMRDPASFDYLTREILPPLVSARSLTSRSIRMWSAGCCTGEEAYSLAITSTRALAGSGRWNLSVLATDINTKFLSKAVEGVYSSWSFRGTPAWLTEQYFSAIPDKKLALHDSVKKMVDFRYLNLAADVYPSLHNQTNAMDVIFCRNVLMYFTVEHQRRVIEGFYNCLVDGGTLLLNPAEAGASLLPMFHVENTGAVIVCRKSPHKGKPPARWFPETTPPRMSPSPALVFEPVLPAIPAPPVPPPPAPAETVPAPAAITAPAPPVEDPLEQARIFANQGRLAEALAACEVAIAANRTSLPAYLLQATVCDELGQVDEALAAWGRVLYLDQDFILAHHALASIYRRLGRPKESGRHLAVALSLLSARDRGDLVPESGGITCGRLLESVRAMAGG
ncbi:MAG: chemotaxis protein CheR [Firmicutes bacterium]|nr:chemotaxis protein CheR [Bacillota bacterium]